VEADWYVWKIAIPIIREMTKLSGRLEAGSKRPKIAP